MALLVNGSFEGVDRPGGWTRDTHNGQEFGEIFTPESWVSFWREGDYRRPEMKVIPKQAPFLDPARIHEGSWSVQAFTFYGRMHAGLYQAVDGLTPGAEYEFTVQAHAWSTTPGLPDYDDAHCSAGVGCGPVYLLPDEVPPLSEEPNKDPVNDAIGNFLFQVGVSFGDPDPFSSSVFWCEGAHIYNKFHGVPSIRFTTQANGKAVVYIRAISLWNFRISDIYLDTATLVQVSDEPPAYASTMLVLPQDATPEQLAEILKIAHPKKRTIGHSHDDAGVLSGTAILYNIPQADRQRYLDWYAKRYPQTKVEFASTSDWDDGILLGQCDAPWGPQRYGDGGGPTFCAKGCWICDCAMCLRHLGLDAEATPLTVDAAVGPDGYDADYAMTWAAMPRAGLKVLDSTTDADIARAHLDMGYVCFAEVLPVSLQHFVMVTRYEGDRYWMYDPWKRMVGWLDEYYAGIESFRLIQPAETTPLPTPAIILSFQQQRAAAYRDEFISRVQPPAWLLIGGFEEAAHLKSLAPDMEIAIRHVDNDWKSYVLASDKDAAAERWLRHHGQTLFDQAEHIKWVLDLNEYTATNDYESLRATPSWIEALVKRFEKEGWPARIIGLNVPVGNPQHNYLCKEQGIPLQIPLLTPAVRLLTDNDCLVSYHSYFGVRKISSGQYYSTLDQPASTRMHYAFRALLSWDPVFTAAGVYPQYGFTEGGPIYINEAGRMVSSGAGWKYRETFDGDVDACVASYLQFQSLVQKWNAEHGNRARWLTAFIHGGFSDWKYFCMSGEPSRKLADALTS